MSVPMLFLHFTAKRCIRKCWNVTVLENAFGTEGITARWWRWTWYINAGKYYSFHVLWLAIYPTCWYDPWRFTQHAVFDVFSSEWWDNKSNMKDAIACLCYSMSQRLNWSNAIETMMYKVWLWHLEFYICYNIYSFR